MTTQEYPIKMRLPSKELVPVKLDCVSQAGLVCLILRAANGDYFEILGFQRDLYPLLLRWAQISNPDASYGQKIRELSPDQVIAYFEASPVLSYLADDVREALAGPSQGQESQIKIDLARVAHLVNPSMADISEVLTGRRYYSGSTYERVKAVHKALNSSSSPPGQGDEGLKMAA